MGVVLSKKARMSAMNALATSVDFDDAGMSQHLRNRLGRALGHQLIGA
jgi:hypothetical protein